jgi:mono/diheme cytochrome c family protein
VRAHPTAPFVRWSLCLALAACSGKIATPGQSSSGGPSGGPSGGASGGGGPGAGAPFVAFDSLARRHSRSELDNTLRDLLGDTDAPATRLLIEDDFSPFDNDYTSQLASQALIDSLEALAQDVAERMVRDPRARAAFLPCSPQSDGDQACFRQLVGELGRRAFRRPLEAAEIDTYLPLLAFATEQNADVDNDFFTAVELFVRALLQDPEFLYRIEIGTPSDRDDVRALTQLEVATRLSYLLWGSTPDDALLERAEQGRLGSAEQRRSEAERLLDDPRARGQLERFHALWLGYRAIPHPPALTTAFARESAALLGRVIFEERRDYFDVFRLEETYLDRTLADHYGLPRPAAESGWVPYGDSGRAGILSHGSVLSAFSKFSDTSPTQRGIFVRTRLLCETVGAPPANVMVDQPPSSDESPCKAARYAAHAQGSCAGCHGPIDSIGFGLERFDIAGRYREHDEGLPECSIEGRGALPGFGSFSGPAELGALLTESGKLETCVVRQYLSFAIGRAIEDGDAEALARLTRSFEAQQRGFLELVLSLVADDAFALRKEPT